MELRLKAKIILANKYIFNKCKDSFIFIYNAGLVFKRFWQLCECEILSSHASLQTLMSDSNRKTLFKERAHRSCHACFTEIAMTLPEWCSGYGQSTNNFCHD